jgi:uncharacterized membrane protein YdjX (TVP38/TMEM64 family)
VPRRAVTANEFKERTVKEIPAQLACELSDHREGFLRVTSVRRNFLLAVGALALGAIAVYQTGAFWYLEDAARLRLLILDTGAAGPLVFIATFSICEAFGFPGVVFVAAASMIWPLWLSILFSWAGGVGAGVLGFAFARTVGREWVQRHLTPRFRRYDARVGESGFTAVTLARVVFFMAPPVHWMFGVSAVRWPGYVLGTALGLLPGIILVSVAGRGLFGWLAAQPPAIWVATAVAITALIFLVPRVRPMPAE